MVLVTPEQRDLEKSIEEVIEMAYLPPFQPPAEHRRADAEAAKRAKEYREQQEQQERRRREERERALIAEQRRNASETSQRR